jgi:DNA-binding NarL/FixJ family response regulator
VLHHAGELVGAASRYEQAAELYEQAGAPFEAARSRLELAGVLATTGQRTLAQREARRALETFRTLGAAREVRRAEAKLTQLTARRPSGRQRKLTGRQIEILRLVAQGMSNPEIAARLRLSDHTVKRHVANLLTRLGLPSRAAAVAYAAKQGLL